MSVTEQHSVWRATGLYWHNRTPGMGLVDSSGTERTYPVLPGTSVGYQLGGQRCCTGVWLAQQRRRRPCPFGHPIPPPATRSQCDPCGSADPGTMLARNATLDDGREYVLYLAWFGPGLTKVGLTATERGTDRLAEQGALAFTWLAHGRLPEIRAAEQRISASGLAPERRQRRVTLAGTVRCAVGRDLLLDTPDGPLLADTRLLAGWPLHPTTAAPTGLQLRACDDAHSDDAATQASLF